jgi:hypothetical protein
VLALNTAGTRWGYGASTGRRVTGRLDRIYRRLIALADDRLLKTITYWAS